MSNKKVIKEVKTKAQVEAEQRAVEAQKTAEELKSAVRRLFSTADGIHVARAMMKMCSMYGLDQDLGYDNERLRAIVGRQFMYKYFIIGMLTPEQRMKIETAEEKK